MISTVAACNFGALERLLWLLLLLAVDPGVGFVAIRFVRILDAILSRFCAYLWHSLEHHGREHCTNSSKGMAVPGELSGTFFVVPDAVSSAKTRGRLAGTRRPRCTRS